jgi:SAM-dependent methyltransferase
MTTSHLKSWLNDHLACPVDHSPLRQEGSWLISQTGHRYPIVNGIPVLLRSDVEHTAWWAQKSLDDALAIAEGRTAAPAVPQPAGDYAIDPWVQEIVAATCGNLYKPLIGRLHRYPIPDLRLPPARGDTFLELGCNWGRWLIAAAQKGYTPVGVDPSLEAVLSAQRVAAQLGLEVGLVVADARYLPFCSDSVDVVFSYSVLQHFSKANAVLAIHETGRVLCPGGQALVQMPNRYGVRSLYNQARRGFAEGSEFDVRYWTASELQQVFSKAIPGATSVSVDGYFGLGIQAADKPLLPRRYRIVVSSSEVLRKMSHSLPFMISAADSLYIQTVKEQA